jgi:hypothetical protein
MAVVVAVGGRSLLRVRRNAGLPERRGSLLSPIDEVLDSFCADWVPALFPKRCLRFGSLRQRALELGRWQRAQAVCVAAVALGVLCATSFALFTALAMHGLLGKAPWPAMDAALKLSWTFVDAIPVLEITKTFGWHDTPVLNDLLGRLLLLGFKVAIVLPIALFIRDALRARRAPTRDDPELGWGLPCDVAEAVRKAIGDSRMPLAFVQDWRQDAASTLWSTKVPPPNDEEWSAALIDRLLRDAARRRSSLLPVAGS